MSDIVLPEHEAEVQQLFARACEVMGVAGFSLRPLRRRVRGKGKLRSYALGYTKLGSKVITVDLYTPRTQQPRRMDAILRVICHEIAHHQSPPRLYRHWFKFVRKIHHPPFWRQVRENVEALKNDGILGTFFAL